MNILLIVFLLFSTALHTATPDDFLPPERAFQVTSRPLSSSSVGLSWKIADHCYLYKHRFKIESVTPGINFVHTKFPQGENKKDHIFGQVEIFKKGH